MAKTITSPVEAPSLAYRAPSLEQLSTEYLAYGHVHGLNVCQSADELLVELELAENMANHEHVEWLRDFIWRWDHSLAISKGQRDLVDTLLNTIGER